MATSIELIKGDITEVEADAIVSGANRDLMTGGSAHDAIHKAAGPGLKEECKQIGECPVGEARITSGHNLPAKHVIHTVGPFYGSENGEEDYYLAKCYYESLKLADEKGLNTIAFPYISTGVFRYPKDEAAEIAISAIREFLEKHPNTNLQIILFVAYSETDYKYLSNEMKAKGLLKED